MKNNIFQFIFYLIGIINLFGLRFKSNNLYFSFTKKKNNLHKYN